MSESEVVQDDEISLRELVTTLISAWKVLGLYAVSSGN